MSASFTPARFAASSVTVVVAPLSNTTSMSLPFSFAVARSAWRPNVRSKSCSRSTLATVAGSSAQYAMLVFVHSSLGNTKRIMPCARSYSVSAKLSRLRPMTPMAPLPISLPPTMKSTSGIVPLDSFR